MILKKINVIQPDSSSTSGPWKAHGEVGGKKNRPMAAKTKFGEIRGKEPGPSLWVLPLFEMVPHAKG